MTRKLLPYERQLVEALGISEEEYVDFLQAQFDYTTTPEQRLEKPQAGVEVYALVVAIVGVIAQAASLLLMPKPSAGGRRQPREQVFAPRLGFNSAQELAKYGETVNLVYTNTAENATGGVRVATSLIWSAIDSYGSSQFMQMMLVLGAGRINAIDATRIAFGQTPIRQFATQRTWAYYNPIGNLRFSDLIVGDASDPVRLGAANSTLVYRTNPQGAERREGFSQAFSPSTLTKCGVFFPIPINVEVVDRKGDGGIQKALIGITVDSSFRNTYWSAAGRRPIIEIGTQFTLSFEQSRVTEAQKKDVFQAAAEKRRTLFGGLDAASTYKLGSAKFRIASAITSADLDAGPISVTFVCIERGSCPEEDYTTTDYKQNEQDAINTIIQLQSEIETLQEQIISNPPIYLPTNVVTQNVEPALNARLAQIQAELDALTDYEETQGKTKNFSDIEQSSIYPASINNLIAAIDANEEQIADHLLGGLTRKEKSQVAALRKQIDRQERELRRLFIDFFDGPFRATRKQRLRDIEALRKEMVSLAASNVSASGGGLDTNAMNNRNNGWQDEINAKQLEIDRQQRILDNPENWNDYFHTKCLVKIEEASYETITQCTVVDFALRARILNRITGRAKKYGEKKEETFKNSDNGPKLRTALFWLQYRRTGSPQWTRVAQMFAIRRGTDVDNYIALKFRANDNLGNWQFHFEPIAETAAEMREFGFVNFAYIENSGATQAIQNPDGTRIVFTGTLQARDFDLPPLNNSPSQVDEWSLFSVRSDTQIQFSFDNGPEIEIKAVTEQRLEALSTYPQLYNNLSLLGFNAYSGQGVQDLRSISAFVTQGRLVRRLRDNGTYPSTPDGASSYAPDIFLDTIIDGVDGIGRFAKPAGIDLQALALAKRFCQRNNLFMDCVIAERTPWRQFWAEAGLFSLLELGRIGGKETLVPAVPTDNAGNIIRRVPISALFNVGNILEDSYKEEYIDYGSSVQDLIATVIYRDTEREGFFARNNSVDVSLAGVTETIAVRQTFDLSQFVTNRAQAILFAKLMCNQRRHIRKAVEFRTFPTDSVLSPGAYIYVDIGQSQWNGIYSGAVQAGGVLNTPITGTIPDGTYSVLLYKSGSSVVTQSSVAISGNTASSLATYDGWLFVLGTSVRSKRVFRITEVQMDEEGEVSVRAIEHACDGNGDSLIANFTDSLFTIR
jgi:hypothetical protein